MTRITKAIKENPHKAIREIIKGTKVSRDEQVRFQGEIIERMLIDLQNESACGTSSFQADFALGLIINQIADDFTLAQMEMVIRRRAKNKELGICQN